MNSMERSLQLGLALLLLILMIAAWAMINRSIHGLVEDFVVSRLEHDAENMIGALEPDTKRTRVRWRRINNIYNKVGSGHYYTFKFDDGRVINSPSLWEKTLAIPPVKGAIEHRFQTKGPKGEIVLVWAKKHIKDGHTFILAVGEDLSPIKQARQQFKRNLAALGAAGFVLLLFLQTRLIRRSFKKLDRTRTDVKKLQRGEKTKLSNDVPDEIKPLVINFNALLETMAGRLTRSRNSLGNLAHALKGPLNLLIQSLNNPKELNQVQALEQADRIKQLIDRELKRGRLAGHGTTSARFDAASELPALIKVLKQVHRDKALKIECRLDEDLPPFADREDMMELIGNILDNACKWAKSSIICTVQLDPNFLVTIEDDGPSLPQHELDQLTKRGVRLDENIEGSGLGLAIAKDIVKLYGGTLSFDCAGELGGLRASISLPYKAHQ